MTLNFTFPLTISLLAATLISCGGGGGGEVAIPINNLLQSSFSLSSSVAVNGALPATYTCDGTGSSPALSWSGAPSAASEFAVLMTSLPGDGSTKYNWVLYSIPAIKTALNKDSYGIGLAGVGSDGPISAYQAPCSQGLGSKTYTFTLYALSAAPVLPTTVTGAALISAMSSITLATTSLSLSYNRTAAAAGLAANCINVANSVRSSTAGAASVGCDDTYAYISSNGLPTHAMMNDIVASNLHVPVAQNFYGANGWKIPLNPALAASTTSAVDGPIGVAINGVPIFNPCKQGGCLNGDTKVLGELDACNGHAGRADDYHYHAAPTCLMAGQPSAYWDTHPLGWALDGFAIFGYNDANGTVASRDGVCGGNTSAVVGGPAGYSYHVTDTSPYVLSCFRGTPSPDLLGQGAKFSPIRQPPVTPFPVSAMTLAAASDGYQVLQFNSAAFTSTSTGNDRYSNAAGTYRIRFKPVAGASLAALLAQTQHAGKAACWNFEFTTGSGVQTQLPMAYCR